MQKEYMKKNDMNDLISRQAAIDAFEKYKVELPTYSPRETDVLWNGAIECCVMEVEDLPTVQPEISALIKKIRFWINSNNRNNADYQIVDEIEKIINEYEYERASDDRDYCETYNPDDGSM